MISDILPPAMEYSQQLVNFLNSQIGEPPKPFANARRLSKAMHRSENIVLRMKEKGNATPPVLADLARATNVSPIELFVYMGWITEREAKSRMTSAEEEWLATYHRLPKGTRPMVRKMLEGLVGSGAGAGPASPAAS